MKIAICGSMAFGKEILKIQKDLEDLGHKVVTPANIGNYANGNLSVEDKWQKLKFDSIKFYYSQIKKQDAILVINKDKNGISNYVGGNTLIEMAFAHVLDKKIFLLNPIPKMSYSDELEFMNPIVLSGNLDLIN